MTGKRVKTDAENYCDKQVYAKHAEENGGQPCKIYGYPRRRRKSSRRNGRRTVNRSSTKAYKEHIKNRFRSREIS